MRLVFRPIVKTDLAEALECVPDSYGSDRGLKDALESMWVELIGRDAAFGACIEDLDRDFSRRIVAVAIAVATPQVVADEIAAGRWPLVALRTLEAWSKRRIPILGPREIAAGNAGSGVNLAVLHFGAASDLLDKPEANPIVDRLESLVHFLASGFHLRSIQIEAFGKAQCNTCLAMRFVERAGVADALAASSANHAGLQPHVLGMTASESASLRGTTMASLFTYTPPILGLSMVERQLLLFALGGITDQELATLLCVSYATVRKRWDSIYTKVAVGLPHVCAIAGEPGDNQGRGSEKRRRVLRYVLFHASEMRPYSTLAKARTHRERP